MVQTVLNSINALPVWLQCLGGFTIGITLLVVGANWLVHGAVTIARRLGMPVLLVGLTIVAAGTSSPELAFNLSAAWDGHGDLCFGNVIGSNIANIGLVLGLCAVVGTLSVHSTIVKRELPWLVGITCIMVGLALLPTANLLRGKGEFGFGIIDGVIFLIFFGFILRFWYQQARKDAKDPLVKEVTESTEAEVLPSLMLAILYFLLGLSALLVGGHVTKEAAIGTGELFGLSNTLIGLSVVAVATSLPELVTSIVAVRKGHADLAIGNVIGSNIFNILLVLGITSLIAPVPLQPHWGIYDLFAMLLLTLVLFPIALSNQNKITRIEGIMLFLTYLAYLAFSFLREYRADLFDWF
ncbi:MAG: calcium/sodium antiporter [Planctomycetota bacterium]|nr:calcium/sodium antiporter [Planctomycetota bacterium]